MKKNLLLTGLLILFSTMLFAADIDGKWNAKVETDMGEFTFVMEYKADGEKLSGTMISSDMGNLQFTDGKISGNEIEYTIDMQGMLLKYKGTIDGDKINMKSTSDFGDNEFVMTRVKE